LIYRHGRVVHDAIQIHRWCSASSSRKTERHDGSGFDWIGLDWIGLDWILESMYVGNKGRRKGSDDVDDVVEDGWTMATAPTSTAKKCEILNDRLRLVRVSSAVTF
jgi:hypothetical protein